MNPFFSIFGKKHAALNNNLNVDPQSLTVLSMFFDEANLYIQRQFDLKDFNGCVWYIMRVENVYRYFFHRVQGWAPFEKWKVDTLTKIAALGIESQPLKPNYFGSEFPQTLVRGNYDKIVDQYEETKRAPSEDRGRD